MKKLLSILMSLAMVLTYMPASVYAADGDCCTVGGQSYSSLSDAFAAANEGDTVEITAAGTYTLPEKSKNITVKADVGGVVFDCTGTGNICAIPNGATFENVTMNFGSSNYHGFQHAGTINMNGCTLNGKLFSYGDMNFNGCTFNAPGTAESGVSDKDYSMWAYGMDLTYTDCTFNCAGKCINVYNEGGNLYKVSFDGCTFNSTVSNKAAVNVKETSGSTILNREVEINNCTCNENFPQPSSSDALVVINGLVQVDDRMAGGTPAGGEIKVNVDGKQVYASTEIAKVAQIGDKYYSSLQDALNDAVKANSDVTVELLDNIDLTGTDWTPVNLSTNKNTVTVEGNNKVITGLNEMLFGKAWASKGLVIKNLTIKDSDIVHNEANVPETEGVGAFIGYIEATETVTLDNCHVIDSTVNGGNWVGGFVGACGGYNNPNDGPVFTTLTITGSSVEGCTIKNKGAAGAFIGHGSMNAATKVVLDGSATGNSITGEKPAKTGKLIGTVGAGGPEAFNGEKGGIELNATESGNTGAENVAGRIGTAGGTMIVTGGSYESDPCVTSDNATGTIALGDSCVLIENNGVFKVTGTAQLADEIAMLQEQLEALQKDSEADAEEIKKLQDKVAELSKMTNETLEKRVAELEATVDTLESSLVKLIQTNLQAKVTNYNTVKLTWNTTGLQNVKYTVYYKESSATSWTKLTEMDSKGNGANMTFTKTGLRTGTKYNFYAVPSMDVNGQTYKGANSVTVSAKPLPGKSKVVKVAPGKARFKATFKKVDGASGYQIKYRRNGAAKFRFKAGKTAYRTVTKLKGRNRNYTVYVRAYRIVDGKRVYGAWSAAKRFKIK